MKIRKKILEEATNIVCSDREQQYGAPEDNFRLIGELWGIYLEDSPYTPRDVAMMLALLKVARIRTGRHKLDNYVDLAGYTACAAEIADKVSGYATGPVGHGWDAGVPILDDVLAEDWQIV